MAGNVHNNDCNFCSLAAARVLSRAQMYLSPQESISKLGRRLLSSPVYGLCGPDEKKVTI